MLVRYRCDRLDQRLSQKKTNKNSTYLLVTISLSFISVLSNQMWSWVFASVLSKKPNKPGCRWPTLQQIHKSTSWCFKKKNKMSKKKTSRWRLRLIETDTPSWSVWCIVKTFILLYLELSAVLMHVLKFYFYLHLI